MFTSDTTGVLLSYVCVANKRKRCKIKPLSYGKVCVTDTMNKCTSFVIKKVCDDFNGNCWSMNCVTGQMPNTLLLSTWQHQSTADKRNLYMTSVLVLLLLYVVECVMTEWLYGAARCVQEESYQSDWTLASVWRLLELCHWGIWFLLSASNLFVFWACCMYFIVSHC